MYSVPLQFVRAFDAALERAAVAQGHRPHYQRWLRFYLDFCHKYAFDPLERASGPRFERKLQEKQQAEWMREQLVG